MAIRVVYVESDEPVPGEDLTEAEVDAEIRDAMGIEWCREHGIALPPDGVAPAR